MTSALPFADGLCFIVFPYLAMFVFFLGTIMRYRKAPFTYSSFSSQFLENKQHFWGLVPFHYGIVAVLLGHIVAFLIPREILAWNSRPLRLYVLEISALIFGLLTLVGLLGAIHRRLTFSKVRAVTTSMDWVVFVLLLAQVAERCVRRRLPSVGFIVVRGSGGAISLVARQVQPGSGLYRDDATDREIPHRDGLYADRSRAVHSAGTHPRDAEPLLLAQKPSCALVSRPWRIPVNRGLHLSKETRNNCVRPCWVARAATATAFAGPPPVPLGWPFSRNLSCKGWDLLCHTHSRFTMRPLPIASRVSTC